MTHHDLLTVQETADVLGVTPRRVYQLIEAGDLRAVRTTPRNTRVPRHELAHYIETTNATLASERGV